MGTSLTVHPFASLAGMADRQSCPRVLINIERVGDLGSRRDDVVLLGKCDDVVRELCEELGWSEELEKLWAETQRDEGKGEKKKEEEEDDKNQEEDKEDKENEAEALKNEVEHLTAAIAARLDLLDTTETKEAASKEDPNHKAENTTPEDVDKSKSQQEISQKHSKVPIPQSDNADTPDVTQGPYYKPSLVRETKPGDPSVDNEVKL